MNLREIQIAPNSEVGGDCLRLRRMPPWWGAQLVKSANRRGPPCCGSIGLPSIELSQFCHTPNPRFRSRSASAGSSAFASSYVIGFSPSKCRGRRQMPCLFTTGDDFLPASWFANRESVMGGDGSTYAYDALQGLLHVKVVVARPESWNQGGVALQLRP